MSSTLREFQSFLYILGAAIGVALFIFTSNQLLFGNRLIPGLGTLGNWSYWVFALSIILMAVFFYFYISLVSDARKFESMINSGSKNTFVKNMRDLDRIARKLGTKYLIEYRDAKEKWKVK